MSARASLFALVVALAGCADGRSVVTLTVTADAPIAGIDRLHIVATDDARHRDAAPVDVSVAAHSVPPDVTVPLAAPGTIRGGLTLTVTALAADGSTVATGTTDVTIAPSKTFAATVSLTSTLHRTLRFMAQPASAKVDASLGSLQVAIVDDAGTTLPDATDVVSLTLAGGGSGAVLSGHVRVAAVAGVATFPDLSVDVAATGYTIAASAPMSDAATSSSFDITPDVWFPLNAGLDGGSMLLVIPDPNDAKSAWALSLADTLWHTKDNGASWAQYGATLPAGAVGGVAVSTKTSDTIFLSGSDKPLRRSDDGGASWDVVGNNLPPPAQGYSGGSVTVDPTDDSIVYFQMVGGLFVSTDRGDNFTMLTAPSSPTPPLIDPTSHTTLYTSGFVSGTTRGLFKSTDSGATWTQLTGGLPNTSLNLLAIAPSDGALYAREASTSGHTYRSTDHGSTWTAVGATMGAPTQAVFDLVDSSVLYGGGLPGAALLRSGDGGATWQTMNNAGIPIGAQQTARPRRAADGGLWVTPLGGAPYRSMDNKTFTFAGNGIKALQVSSIGFGCGNPYSYCIGTTSRGVFGSQTGATWQAVGTMDPGPQLASIFVVGQYTLVQEGALLKNDGTNNWTAVTIPGAIAIEQFALRGSSMIATDDNGAIWTSTNGGSTWTQSSTPLPAVFLGSAENNVLIDPINTMTSYIWGMGFLVKSTNGGAMYTDVQPDPTGKPTYLAMAMDPNVTQTLYLSTATGLLYKTTNGAGAWAAVGQGLPAGDAVVSLAVSPMASTRVYASTSSSALYKSSDGGATFKKVAAPPGLLSIAADYGTPDTVLAATSLGVWRTTTGGE